MLEQTCGGGMRKMRYNCIIRISFLYVVGTGRQYSMTPTRKRIQFDGSLMAILGGQIVIKHFRKASRM
jgi:hypothetical protein